MEYIIIFIIGLCIGSFLNVVIYRLHKKESFIKGRSYCPKCRHKLSWLDNIPLISWVFLKARCRYCNERISLQYPLVELAGGALFALALFTADNYLLLVSYCFFISILIIIFVYDLKWYLILDKVTVPAIAAAGLFNIILGHSIFNLLSAAFAISGFFLLQFLISKGKWIGGGDIRLGFLMGIMLGWPIAIAALFISYIAGAIIGVGLIITGKKKMSSQVPFGTFLSVGTIIALLYGDMLMRWIMRF